MTNLARIGIEIRNAREQQGITTRALAELSGVSKRALISIEGGTYNPSVALLEKLAKALNITLTINPTE